MTEYSVYALPEFLRLGDKVIEPTPHGPIEWTVIDFENGGKHYKFYLITDDMVLASNVNGILLLERNKE
jgi:hypothetical protein